MAVVLEGGCRVTGIRDWRADYQWNIKSLAADRAGRRRQGNRITNDGVCFGLVAWFAEPGNDEILYVLEGTATIFIDGQPHPVQPEAGVYSTAWYNPNGA